MTKLAIILLIILINSSLLIAQNDSLKMTKDLNSEFLSRDFSRMNSTNFLDIPNMENRTTFFEKLWKNSVEGIKSTTGYFDLGYSYGLNTIFSDSTRGVASILNSSGSLQTSLMGLPVLVSYNYSTLRVPLGANNYFRISFDKQAYIEGQKEKLNDKLGNVSKINDKLNNKRAKIAKLQGKSEVYMDMLQRKIEIEARKIEEKQKQRVRDSIQLAESKDREDLDNRKAGVSDSLNSDSTTNKSDSILSRINKSKEDIEESKQKYEKLKEEYERVQNMYQKLLVTRQTCDSLIDNYNEYQDKLLQYKDKLKNPDISTYEGKAKDKLGFISSIQKIDIGLTYPKTTGMSDQNVAVKGIGTEFQYKNFYFAFTIGSTLDNMMLSTNEITNQLQNNQNVFNQFDFQHVKDNGLLTSVKTGYGSPETTHAFIGFNYLTNTKFLNEGDINTSNYDPAASMELDLRYVPTFYKGGALDLVYGKTSANHQLDTVQREVFGSLFSSYPSHTFMTKYTQNVSIIRSRFSIQYRSIDPLANTTVFGVMQPGNRRVAFESKHNINSYLKIGTTYKYDQSYGDTPLFKLYTKGINVSGAYDNYLTYSAMLNHVNFVTEGNLGEIKKGASYISGINLQSHYNVKGFKAMTGISYNDYLFVDTANATKFSQFGISEAIKGKDWALMVSYDYFFQRAEITEMNSVFGIGLKWSREKVKIDGGLKLNVSDASSLGGHLEINWEMMKHIEVAVRGERFVKGNFYQNYFDGRYDQFPYLFTINTRFKF